MKSVIEILAGSDYIKEQNEMLHKAIQEYRKAKTPLGELIMKQLNIKTFLDFHQFDKKQQYDELITRYREDK